MPSSASGSARSAEQVGTSTTQRLPRALLLFFVLAYGLSWAWAVPMAAAGLVVDRGDGWPTHYPALVGPALAALVVTAWSLGRPGLRDLVARTLRWRVPLRWWLVALSPAAMLAVALLVMAAAGRSLPDAADFGRFSGTPEIGVLGVVLVITFVGALGEETGWRGYALPHLQRRFSPLVATLVLAPLWFAWHLPQFFVIRTYRDFGPGEYVGMLLGLSCGAVVLTWLYNRSGGSILLVTVWHGVYNAVGATEAAAGALAAVISTLIMVQGIALVVLDVRARRRGLPSPLDPRAGKPRPLGIWVTNHVANPVLRPVLRSRLGRPLGRHVALLRFHGRRSGRCYEIPVQYARTDDHVWILPASPEDKTWWRNLRTSADVDLTLAGHDVHGTGVVLDRSRPDELAEGVAAYLRAVPQARRALDLGERSAQGRGAPDGGTVLVRIDLDREEVGS